jgi:hypothetical protein
MMAAGSETDGTKETAQVAMGGAVIESAVYSFRLPVCQASPYKHYSLVNEINK